MRLLHLEDDGQMRLLEFSTDPPPYAILSHTWGADDEEVTFQDMSQGGNTFKPGYDKIHRCRDLAASNGLRHFWVDSCCIDKSSSAELSEAINSMFRYYQDAAICYVYLADLDSHTWDLEKFKRCRWLTRGWTLQELLAPKEVRFFGKNWDLIGDKGGLAEAIEAATRIPVSVLVGTQELRITSIATRMSWASSRQTKRPEDMAYCMLGIFEVNMPLLYGEGTRAFRRLQEEIVKRNNDLTIFAWDNRGDCVDEYSGLFASTPASFASSPGIAPFSDDNAGYSVTNKGLRLSGDIPLRVARLSKESHEHSEDLYLICLGRNMDAPRVFDRRDDGIFLRKIGPELFCRMGGSLLSSSYKHRELSLLYFTQLHIIIDPTPAVINSAASFRRLGIHVPVNDTFELMEVIPQNLWDVTDRMFLRPRTHTWTQFSSVLMMRFRAKTISPPSMAPMFIVLCDYREEPAELTILHEEKHSQEAALLLQERYEENSISWDELGLLAPKTLELNNSARLEIQNQGFLEISVSLKKTVLHNNINVLGLKFSCKERSYRGVTRDFSP